MFAELVEGGEENLNEALINKGRLIVSIKIVITVENQRTTMTGQFDWFLQLKTDAGWSEFEFGYSHYAHWVPNNEPF